MLPRFHFASNSPVAGVDLDGQEFTWFMTEGLEKKRFGTAKRKDLRNGIAQRAVETATGPMEAAPAIVKKTLSDFDKSGISSVADPSLG